MKKLLTLCALMSVLGASANAAPIQWSVNGHYYDLVSPNEPLSWNDAKLGAENLVFQGMHGHLVTITSGEENYFISNHLQLRPINYFLGGFQMEGSTEPDGGWAWVTGEQLVYTNWIFGQPNNWWPNENAMYFSGENSDGLGWNDLRSEDNYYFGYVVEYEPTSTPVPEPASMLLGMLGLGGVFGLRKKQS